MFLTKIATAVAMIAATLALSSVAANATPITRTYSFSAADFVCVGPGCPATVPVSPVVGSITVTFDPMGPPVSNSTDDVFLNSININVGALAKRYTLPDTLTLGGAINQAGGLNSFTDDFQLYIENASSSSPTASLLSFTQIGQPGAAFNSDNVSVSFVDVTNLNEPAGALLFSTGVLVLIGAGLLFHFRTPRRHAPASAVC